MKKGLKRASGYLAAYDQCRTCGNPVSTYSIIEGLLAHIEELEKKNDK